MCYEKYIYVLTRADINIICWSFIVLIVYKIYKLENKIVKLIIEVKIEINNYVQKCQQHNWIYN